MNSLPQPMKVASFNVNGLRAAQRKGFSEWLREEQPDILMLQETRAPENDVKKIIGPGYLTVVDPGFLPGRAGVSLSVRKDSGLFDLSSGDLDAFCGLEEDEDHLSNSGRWIEVHLQGLDGKDYSFASSYVHSGELGTLKHDLKLVHLNRVTKRMEENTFSVVGGDFNIVRSLQDIKTWSAHHNKTSGVTDHEIQELEKILELGYSDAWRDAYHDSNGYTYFSYRGRSFDNNAGWRLDYQFLSENMMSRLEHMKVVHGTAWDTRISDHGALVATFG